MIISDTHQFVFIHIPKCAGSSIRKTLITLDEKTVKSGRHKHPDFGLFDYNHIPLSIMRAFFPNEYYKAKTYYSFAIMRDPFKRFSSSIGQRMKSHKKRRLSQLTAKELEKEADETIKLLVKYQNAEILPADLIHFQKQKSYIYDGDSLLIDSVYHLNQINQLFADLENKFDLSFNAHAACEQVNKSKPVYKNELLRSLDQKTAPARRMVMKFVPLYPKQALKSMFRINPKKLDIFHSDYVRDFIDDFYYEDIVLYNSLIQAESLHKASKQ